MRRLAPAILVGLAIIIAFLAGYWFRGWITVDACLDRGGRWNEQMATCEYAAAAREGAGAIESEFDRGGCPRTELAPTPACPRSSCGTATLKRHANTRRMLLASPPSTRLSVDWRKRQATISLQDVCW